MLPYPSALQPDDSCGVVDLYYLRALTGLTRLDLRHTELTPSSSHHITVLRNLRELDLSGGKQSYGSKSWVNAFRKLKVSLHTASRFAAEDLTRREGGCNCAQMVVLVAGVVEAWGHERPPMQHYQRRLGSDYK